MSSNQFLVFNGFVVFLLVVSFLLLFTKKPTPSKLNLRKGNNPSPVQETGLDFGGEEELNVLFNYNGHLWDAFEVLGIPAGSDVDVVEKAYEQSLHRMDPSSRELVDLAFQAIQQRMRSSV